MNLSKIKSGVLTGAAGAAVAPMVALAGGSAADAADLALKAPPPVVAPSWAGFYIGANIGGGSEGSYFNDPAPILPSWRDGGVLIGGGQIGYNWQQGTFVYGLEADFSGLTKPGSLFFHSTTANPIPTYGSSISWLSTVRGRLGVTVGDGNTLLYGTGGAAFGRVHAFANEMPSYKAYNDYSSTRVGWAAGGGIERMISPHWTIGLEGLFVDLGSYTKASSDGGKCCAIVHNTVGIGRLRLDYKF